MSEIQETSEKISIITPKEIEDHAILALKLDWDALASMVIDLQLEIHELRPYMTKEEIEHREGVLWVYETAKYRMMAMSSRGPEYLKQVVDKELFGDEVLSDEYY